jgi:ubiquinone biosynthesis protein
MAGPERVRELLERLGPTFVKVGQYLALRPDLLPQEYCDELMRLLDRVPPFPWEEARAILEDELGDLERSFDSIEPRPLAAGSLAQTHRARLLSGEPVVVKVQRPGVREAVLRDLGRLRAIARVLQTARVPVVVEPRELAAELRRWMLQELDLERERANMERLGELAAGSEIMRIPRAYRHLCGRRVLTAEYVRGIPFSDLLASLRSGRDDAESLRARAGVDLELLASNLLEATLTQIFELRFFHADLHPGNLIALPGGRIGFVDFGLCDELDEAVQRRQLQYISALYEGDAGRMYNALGELLVAPDESRLARFRRDFTPPPRDGAPIAEWMVEVMRLVRRHDLRLPPRVLSMYRALFAAETVADAFGARATLRSVGRDFFVALRRRQAGEAFGREDLEAFAISLVTLLRDAPEHLERGFRERAEGRFELGTDAVDSPGAVEARRVRTRMTAGAAATVALAAALALPDLPEAGGVSAAWPLATLLCALYASLLLGWRRLR